jgi:hypothetical protein
MIVYSGTQMKRQIFNWNFAKSNEEFQKITNDLRAVGGTTDTKAALEDALKLMDTRNKTIPTLIMVVTDGRSGTVVDVPAKELQAIPDLWMFAAAAGDPRYANRFTALLFFVMITYTNCSETNSWKLLAILIA